jgi:hypothetical protein
MPMPVWERVGVRGQAPIDSYPPILTFPHQGGTYLKGQQSQDLRCCLRLRREAQDDIEVRGDFADS